MIFDHKENIKIGFFWKNLRLKANLTQKQVAHEFGYTTPQFISNWERGLIAPPPDKVPRLIHIYKADPTSVYIFYRLITDQHIKAVCGLNEGPNA